MLLYRINIDFNILEKKEQILGTGQKRANFGQKGYFLGTQKILDKKEIFWALEKFWTKRSKFWTKNCIALI